MLERAVDLPAAHPHTRYSGGSGVPEGWVAGHDVMWFLWHTQARLRVLVEESFKQSFNLLHPIKQNDHMN